MEPNFFLRSKPVEALVALSDKNRSWYASLLAKETDCTYAHMIKILDSLSQENLVVFERQGRVKHVKLTDSGEELAHDFETVLRRLQKPKKSKKEKKESLGNAQNVSEK